MDMFIQKNFFSGPSQIALVLDPLSGDEAVCVNTPDGAASAAHFWVDGRRRTCRRPDKDLPAARPPQPTRATLPEGSAPSKSASSTCSRRRTKSGPSATSGE